MYCGFSVAHREDFLTKYCPAIHQLGGERGGESRERKPTGFFYESNYFALFGMRHYTWKRRRGTANNLEMINGREIHFQWESSTFDYFCTHHVLILVLSISSGVYLLF